MSTSSELEAEIQRLHSQGLLLICIDDLPRKLAKDDLDKLDRLMDRNKFPDVLIIATARDDDLTQVEFPQWLKRQQFHPVPISGLSEEFVDRLLENYLKDTNLSMTDSGKEAFTRAALQHQFTVYELVSILDYLKELQTKDPQSSFDRDLITGQMSQSKASFLARKQAEIKQVNPPYSVRAIRLPGKFLCL